MKAIAVVTAGAGKVIFPGNPSVGDYFTCVQDCSITQYVFDGCKWLLFASEIARQLDEDDPIKAYDRAMGVV